MKHSHVKIEIETSEKGYNVTRSKSLFAWADPDIMLILSDDIEKWLKNEKSIITVFGCGLYKDYNTQKALVRIIIDKQFKDCPVFSLVTWDNDDFSGDRREYPSIKDLKTDLKSRLKLIAGLIDYNDHV